VADQALAEAGPRDAGVDQRVAAVVQPVQEVLTGDIREIKGELVRLTASRKRGRVSDYP